MRAFCPPLLLPAPQPLLVVIDLNGTLLHRPNKRSPTKFIERPLARAFLRHCIDTYHVVIWSSARPENVQRMCAQLLPPAYLARVVAVWGRDRFGLTPADYARRTQCYKRLTRLWADPAVRAAHPQSGATGWPAGPRCWDQGNTVLIDDSAEKARSEPHNAVTLPEFAGDLAAEQQLQPWEEELEGEDSQQVLARVAKYLGVLAWQVDVSAYIRARPFTMGPGKGNISGPGA
ncbi:uncharacterized protein THITE_2108247 [Thermothielavioides terrestris NRRL 8126]|jgi:hypothetical protein|uniref:Mitochondrial import inner membrane translocase subunit TIM50 n=2 Tax=Thermothielavioides terrestris TaxID=2587410 RepID=G2QQP7_THETT|nr:uncharacterized protein THITE_2108247 [Thermothielavioides terrestris NRRL 8126]AEO63257.1 hypothetical protein THITE_2108247 [Thermothielavioides terrestris NRRL 8126]